MLSFEFANYLKLDVTNFKIRDGMFSKIFRKEFIDFLVELFFNENNSLKRRYRFEIQIFKKQINPDFCFRHFNLHFKTCKMKIEISNKPDSFFGNSEFRNSFKLKAISGEYVFYTKSKFSSYLFALCLQLINMQKKRRINIINAEKH